MGYIFDGISLKMQNLCARNDDLEKSVCRQ